MHKQDNIGMENRLQKQLVRRKKVENNRTLLPYVCQFYEGLSQLDNELTNATISSWNKLYSVVVFFFSSFVDYVMFTGALSRLLDLALWLWFTVKCNLCCSLFGSDKSKGNLQLHFVEDGHQLRDLDLGHNRTRFFRVPSFICTLVIVTLDSIINHLEPSLIFKQFTSGW